MSQPQQRQGQLTVGATGLLTVAQVCSERDSDLLESHERFDAIRRPQPRQANPLGHYVRDEMRYRSSRAPAMVIEGFEIQPSRLRELGITLSNGVECLEALVLR